MLGRTGQRLSRLVVPLLSVPAGKVSGRANQALTGDGAEGDRGYVVPRGLLTCWGKLCNACLACGCPAETIRELREAFREASKTIDAAPSLSKSRLVQLQFDLKRSAFTIG